MKKCKVLDSTNVHADPLILVEEGIRSWRQQMNTSKFNTSEQMDHNSHVRTDRSCRSSRFHSFKTNLEGSKKWRDLRRIGKNRVTLFANLHISQPKRQIQAHSHHHECISISRPDSVNDAPVFLCENFLQWYRASAWFINREMKDHMAHS